MSTLEQRIQDPKRHSGCKGVGLLCILKLRRPCEDAGSTRSPEWQLQTEASRHATCATGLPLSFKRTNGQISPVTLKGVGGVGVGVE